MTARCLLVLLSVSLLHGGCPGSARVPQADRGRDGHASFLPDQAAASPDRTAPVSHDGGAVSHDRGINADRAQNTVVGGSCPCAAPLLCVLAACRRPCQQVPCNGATDCDPGQACLLTQASISVCVPAVKTGAECTSSVFCQSGSACLTTDAASGKGKCYASCTVEGAACPGGTCSLPAPGQSACLFCY